MSKKDETVIKSVRRVFEILELFDKERRPLQAVEVAKRLGYPTVSTHALLKSMYLLGYADFDVKTRGYSPARSIPFIVDWIPEFFDAEKQFLSFVNELNNETGETINVSRRMGGRIRVIHGQECKHPIGVSTRVGTTMPILHTITGLTAIAGMDAEERDWMISSELERSPQDVVDEATIAGVLKEVAERGSVMRCDLFIAGIGALCAPLRFSRSSEGLVIGIAGPSDRIRANVDSYRESLTRLGKAYKIKLGYT